MIVNPKKYLSYARKAKFAIGHFNICNLETILAVVIAAEEKNAPVFLAITEPSLEYAGLELNILAFEIAKNAKAPIFLHLDHGKNFKIAKSCLNSGFSSIMFDGSDLTLLKNIKITKKFVSATHSKNAACEAELGHVGNAIKKDQFFTNPDDVVVFNKATGVDMLAVSVGNRHGMPIEKEQINYDLIKEINKISSVPLVLHGASSTPSNQIRKIIESGIVKINIDQDLRKSFTSGLEQYLKNHPEEIDPRKILGFASIKMQKTVEAKIELFGSTNKAWTKKGGKCLTLFVLEMHHTI